MLIPNNVNYFTCGLSFILLLIIILSKNIIQDTLQFYFLIIIVLLIIVSCLLDEFLKTPDNSEKFTNMVDETRNCVERSKSYLDYNTKIDTRLDKHREMEEKDRKGNLEGDEQLKNKELNLLNDDYLANGESF